MFWRNLSRSVDVLRNRAITVSTVLCWPGNRKFRKIKKPKTLQKFIDEFVHRLNWQVKKRFAALILNITT